MIEFLLEPQHDSQNLLDFWHLEPGDSYKRNSYRNKRITRYILVSRPMGSETKR